MKPLEDSLIYHLSLLVSLRVAHWHESMVDVQVGVELPRCMVIELPLIVGDGGMEEAKVVDDWLPEERFCFVLSDLY